MPLATFTIIFVRFSFLENIKVVESNSREHIEMLAEHSPESMVISARKLWSLWSKGSVEAEDVLQKKASPRPRILAVCLARAVF